MLYLATASGPKVREAMAQGLIGCMNTPANRYFVPAGAKYAMDNGAYGKGWPGFRAWYRWLLADSGDRAHCLFAAAPDVVGDAVATWERSEVWLPRIREAGYKAALVAQDGIEDRPIQWETFDVLFIGGSTQWKLGPAARRLILDSKQIGKRVHIGRVNSWRRFDYFSKLGADSADGTYVAFGPDENLPKMLRWGALARDQQSFLTPADLEPAWPTYCDARRGIQ